MDVGLLIVNSKFLKIKRRNNILSNYLLSSVSDTIEKICSTEDFLFKEDLWKIRSNFSSDICRRLLAKNPRDRLKAKDAIRHLWFSVNIKKRSDLY